MDMLPITLTGVDNYTNLTELPIDCEIGLLYAVNPQKLLNLYPNMYALHRIINTLHSNNYRIALHVCGSAARHIVMSGGVDDLIGKVQRLQFNGKFKIDYIESVCDRFPNHTIITQHHDANEELLFVRRDNHQILIDGSGGKGIVPKEWSRPVTDKIVGFSGGLSPRNIADEYLNRIKPLTRQGFWLDMESSLRDESGRFSNTIANNVAKICREMLAE